MYFLCDAPADTGRFKWFIETLTAELCNSDPVWTGLKLNDEPTATCPVQACWSSAWSGFNGLKRHSMRSLCLLLTRLYVWFWWGRAHWALIGPFVYVDLARVCSGSREWKKIWILNLTSRKRWSGQLLISESKDPRTGFYELCHGCECVWIKRPTLPLSLPPPWCIQVSADGGLWSVSDTAPLCVDKEHCPENCFTPTPSELHTAERKRFPVIFQNKSQEFKEEQTYSSLGGCSGLKAPFIVSTPSTFLPCIAL